MVQSLAAPAYLAGRDATVRVRVVDATPPDSVVLSVRPAIGGFYRRFTMRPSNDYEFAGTIRGTAMLEGPHRFVVTVFHGGSATTLPGGTPRQPSDWNYDDDGSWAFDVVTPSTPLRLFDPATDAAQLAFTRIGDAGRRGIFQVPFSRLTGRPVFHFERPVDARGWSPDDYTASLIIKERIDARAATLGDADALQLRLRGLGPRQLLHLTLMENDGTSWGAAVAVDSSWHELVLPLAAFTLTRGVLLPEGFPGEWNYWVGPAAGRGGSGDRPRLEQVERLQLSFRREDGLTVAPGSYGVEVESIILSFRRSPTSGTVNH
jgi:hypothetical protein